MLFRLGRAAQALVQGLVAFAGQVEGGTELVEEQIIFNELTNIGGDLLQLRHGLGLAWHQETGQKAQNARQRQG